MDGLFAELKRRNVFRVGVAYLALAWVVIEVTGMAVPALNLPDSLNSIVFYLGLIGFPFALFFSWAFELTPGGLMKTADVDASQSITHSTGRKLDFLVIGLLAIAVIFMLWDGYLSPEPEASQAVSPPEAVVAAQTASIAVLPFTDLSPAGDQAYFADGLSEEILNVLVGVDALAVASRTSSFQFKNRETGVPEIATALNVAYILEGSVRKAGGKIRVTGQLIEAASDRHLWSDTYDRELTTENIFAIQDEIATAIVAALSAELNLAETPETVTVRGGASNLSAYETFLRGRDQFHKRSQISDIAAAIETLEEAVALDPDFAQAWMWLGAAYGVATGWGLHLTDADRDFPDLAAHAAGRALEIDPDLGFAYGVSGLAILGRPDGDHLRAVALFERGLALAPKNATMQHWMGIALADLGFPEDAVPFFDRCAALDPAFLNCHFQTAQNYFYLGDYAKALAGWNMDPAEMIPANYWNMRIAFALAAEGQTYGARLLLSHELASEPDFPALSWIKVVQKAPGSDKDARPRVEAWLDNWMTGQDDVNSGWALEDMVFLYLSIGAYDKVPTEGLTYGLGAFKGIWVKDFSAYRRTANFKRMVRNMNFLPYWQARGFPPGCRAVGAQDFECD